MARPERSLLVIVMFLAVCSVGVWAFSLVPNGVALMAKHRQHLATSSRTAARQVQLTNCIKNIFAVVLPILH